MQAHSLYFIMFSCGYVSIHFIQFLQDYFGGIAIAPMALKQTWNKIASLKKEAECTLAALQLLIAWGERRACALVKFSNIMMKEIC